MTSDNIESLRALREEKRAILRRAEMIDREIWELEGRPPIVLRVTYTDGNQDLRQDVIVSDPDLGWTDNMYERTFGLQYGDKIPLKAKEDV